MRVKPTIRILCVDWLVRASRAKTKLPRLHIQFHQHRVLIDLGPVLGRADAHRHLLPSRTDAYQHPRSPWCPDS
eukprot:scaffold2107_cov145-Amphora_coffeaeformis.AAC.2